MVAKQNRGWILDAICREIAKTYPGDAEIHYSDESVPHARTYFFSHYSLFERFYRRHPVLRRRYTVVFFTHPPEDESLIPRLARRLNGASLVVSMSSLHAQTLIKRGLHPVKVRVVTPGADPDQFQGHKRGNGCVGFSSAYYPRKSPDAMLEIVRLMPHRRFILLGRGWERYARFRELQRLENFSYVDAPYSDYPRYYSAMDVFVSPSKIEGGPIPLIEAMMCNAVPVATTTGFAPEVIRHEVNGYLYDFSSRIEHVCDLIEQGFDLETDVRSTVLHLTWSSFVQQLNGLLQPR